MTETPAVQRFHAWRNADWAPTLVYPYPGAQLPAIDHVAMQLRRTTDDGPYGDVLLTCNPIDHDDALVSGTAGGADEVRWLTLSPHFSPGELTGLPQTKPLDSGDDQPFAFDIRITYADDVTELLSTGTFLLSPGVTTV